MSISLNINIFSVSLNLQIHADREYNYRENVSILNIKEKKFRNLKV